MGKVTHRCPPRRARSRVYEEEERLARVAAEYWYARGRREALQQQEPEHEPDYRIE